MKSSSTTGAGPTRSTVSSPSLTRRTPPRCAPPGPPPRSSACRDTARSSNTRTPRANGTPNPPPAWTGRIPPSKTARRDLISLRPHLVGCFQDHARGADAWRKQAAAASSLIGSNRITLQLLVWARSSETGIRFRNHALIVAPGSLLLGQPLRQFSRRGLGLLRGGLTLGSRSSLRGRRRGGIARKTQCAQPLGIGINGLAGRVVFGHGLLGVFGPRKLHERVIGFLVRHIGSCRNP